MISSLYLFTFFVLLQIVTSTTVTYDWKITWVEVNPDGQKLRPATGINGKWPCPAISANVGDTIVVNVHNQLGNETTSLHFHGLFMEGNNAMDGPPGVVQCPIAPGSSFTYRFEVNQPGTYWYHSHSPGQYTDGFRGPLIVHDPNSPYDRQYDEELVLTVSDWYHDEMPGLLNYYLSPEQNADGAEPVPYSALLNEAQSTKLFVKPGKTYFVRIISMAAFAQHYLHFDQHTVTIIEIDGVYTEPQTVDSLYIATAQRYGVLLKTKNDASQNFAILSSFDTDKFDNVPNYLTQNVTGYLVYDASKPFPAEAPPVSLWNVIDDFSLVPKDGQRLLDGKPDQSIVLNLDFFNRDEQNRAGFNNITYVTQKVPTLYTALSTGRDAEDVTVYGVNTNAFVIKKNDLVEVVINNLDSGAHPIHLHGHAPQIVAREPNISSPSADDSSKTTSTYTGDTSSMPKVPMRRDTWLVAASGYTVIRFVAKNPGVWLIHCHMEWHVEAGAMATLVVAPRQLQAQQSIPAGMDTLCKTQGIPTEGNAAGNMDDYRNLTGANTVARPNPWGALLGTGLAPGSHV